MNLPRIAPLLRRALRNRPRLLAALLAVCALVVFTATVWAARFSYDLTAGLPDATALHDIGDMAQSTTLFDADDRPVFTIYKEQRIEVPLERMSPHLIQAVLSVEDQRFYEHNGVDAIRVAAAVVGNLRAGRRAQGGSTITQQLARQSFLTRDKTFRRKLKEVILAARIEHQFSKHDILELYLNKVYFGDGLYGVEAASRGYFGKHAAELTVPEAALLAGLIQSPSSYAPTVNRDRAIARRNVVLQTMVASGAIKSAEAENASRAQVELVDGLKIEESFGLYFKEEVRKELVQRFGWQRVYQGGLQVYTTLDPKLQQIAEKQLEKGLEDIEHGRAYAHDVRVVKAVAVAGDGPAEQTETPEETGSPAYLQGALVAMDPHTGAVRALIGGRDFDDSRFDRATQARRQPGSAFKPLVYATALEAGYTPATLITGLNNPIATDQGDWVPEDEHSDASAMTLRTALRTSSNRAAVQLLDAVGIQKTVSYAEKLHIPTPPSVPSLALGSGDVTLLTLTAAYGAFADKGIVHSPFLIRKVVDRDGNVLYEDPQSSSRAFSESTAFLMSSMLADVINAGTAYRARQVGFMLPAAGKTGTTNDYNDAWFIGYTPHLVSGVWVGFDQPQTIVRDGYAAELAVPIWARFMKDATKGEKPDWFDRPRNVIGVNICRLSGKLPNDGCTHVETLDADGNTQVRSLVYTEYFVRGTQPTTECPLHPGVGFFDRLAGVFGKEVGKPVPPDQIGLTAAEAAKATSGQTSAKPDQKQDQKKVEGEKKKRGFWKRLFGIGDDKKKDEKKDPPKKPGGGV
jgi:penicillin-binding protein 1A